MAAKPTAFVTGAGSGIGAATAIELAQRGYAVALGARRKDKLDQVAGRIAQSGGRAFAVQLDVAESASVGEACRAAADELGPIGVLINNAAVIEPICALADADAAAWEQCIRINLVGAWSMTKAVIPGMIAAGSGTIVNVSSGAAVHALEGWSAYCASKAALAMLTRSINREYGLQGIMAYGFRPGLIATAMQETIREAAINPLAGITPDDMMPPERAGAAIAWLAQERPEQWCGETEPDIRDPAFVRDAGL